MPSYGKSTWLESNRAWSYFVHTDYAVSVVWPKSKEIQTSYEIAAFVRAVEDHFGSSLIDYSVGYHSCLLYIDHKVISIQYFISVLNDIEMGPTNETREEELVIIPISVRDDHALDLKEVSSACDLDPSEVLRIFSDQIYTVHFQGFLPGFTYIGGLDPRLNIPRRANPRVQVPAGSVAIAAGQVGIYPIASPGGWHIIGRTSTKLFDVDQDPPSMCKTGLKIRFQVEL